MRETSPGARAAPPGVSRAPPAPFRRRLRVPDRPDQLDRPASVRAVYSRVFTHLAEANRRLGRADEQEHWEQQALAELDALALVAPPTDTSFLAQTAGARFFIGDCTGASQALQQILTIDDHAVYALLAAGTIAMYSNGGILWSSNSYPASPTNGPTTAPSVSIAR